WHRGGGRGPDTGPRAGNQTCHPGVVSTPRTAADVVELVERARHQGRRVKAVGAGHSYTGIAVTDGVQVDPAGLSGVITVDRERRRVRVGAGTPLHVLNPALETLGLALPNLGDIDRQSIAGAISTGTHGTGAALQGIAAAVTGLTIVIADGSVVECSAEETP